RCDTTAKPPHTGGEMGVLYLIYWRRNYPQDRGTRPEEWEAVYMAVHGKKRATQALCYPTLWRPPEAESSRGSRRGSPAAYGRATSRSHEADRSSGSQRMRVLWQTRGLFRGAPHPKNEGPHRQTGVGKAHDRPEA